MKQQTTQLLPPQAREALQRAARTLVDIDPLARQKEIDRVTAWAKAQWPQCFRKDEHENREI